jgi:hypothetical protein
MCFSLLYTTEPKADVLAVYSHEKSNGFKFGVKLKSEERGCKQYADWWEILNEKGELLYRRILVHSHVDEQPFTRWGSLVKIGKKDLLYIRAHMNHFGYNGNLFKGSIEKGFTETKDFPDFNTSIETQTPLPKKCLY